MEMFSKKLVIVVRDDLQVWQKVNIASFLVSGVLAREPDLIGEPYIDAVGNKYHALPRKPIVVLAADGTILTAIHRRALERQVPFALYIEPMFATAHDQANRTVFAEYGPDTAPVVGIALHEDRRVVDRITKGARLHC